MILLSGTLMHSMRRMPASLALSGALIALAACTGAGQPGTGTTTLPASAPAAPQDALGRFVATAAPGQLGTVALADGRLAQVRVVRAYAAASGRECREVLIGEGLGGRASLLCEADGQWVQARPLLLGSGSARP
jgi:hypothetical protein